VVVPYPSSNSTCILVRSTHLPSRLHVCVSNAVVLTRTADSAKQINPVKILATTYTVHTTRHFSRLLSGYWHTYTDTLTATPAFAIAAGNKFINDDSSELVMGHFFKTQRNPTKNFWTQPNPQKSPPDPTQHIIDTWYGVLGYTENFIQQLLHVTDKFTVRSYAVLISR